MIYNLEMTAEVADLKIKLKLTFSMVFSTKEGFAQKGKDMAAVMAMGCFVEEPISLSNLR